LPIELAALDQQILRSVPMTLESGFKQGQQNEQTMQNSSENLTQEARDLYKCGPAGPFVSNPRDCWDMDRKNNPGTDTLPSLQLVSEAPRV
jgi:hypothetical protein